MCVCVCVYVCVCVVEGGGGGVKERLKKMLDIFIEGGHSSNPSLLGLYYAVFERGKLGKWRALVC